jgi:hypothetical protein
VSGRRRSWLVEGGGKLPGARQALAEVIEGDPPPLGRIGDLGQEIGKDRRLFR